MKAMTMEKNDSNYAITNLNKIYHQILKHK